MSSKRPRSRRDNESQPGQSQYQPHDSLSESNTETSRQASELAALRHMLVVSHGIFSLSLVVCNSPALRDHLIGELAHDHPGLVVVSIPPDTIDVHGFVCEQVAALEDRVTAICITNMEQSLPLQAEDYPTLRSLNASRELWKQRFSIPILFWMPDYAAALLSSRARDLWRWFNHQFEFVSVNIEPTLAVAEQFSGAFTDASNLDVNQKRFRIAELEERIQRAGNNPDADLIGHVRHWMNELAYLHYQLGQWAQAEESWRKLLAIVEDTHQPEDMANQYGNLGNVMQTRGDLDGAEKMYRKALKINEQLGQLEGMANQYGNLGIVMQTRGDLDGAEKMYRKALEINEQLGRLEGMANQYGNLGNVMQIHGDLDGAEKMLRKALGINEQLGSLEGMAINYGNLGIVMQIRGDLDGAEKMYLKALEIDEQLGSLEGMASDYGNLGNVMRIRGDLDGAEKMFRKALDINEQLGRLEGMANQYANLGIVMQTRGDLDGAEKMYRKALDINEQLGRLEGMASAYGNLGNVMRIRGDLGGAEKMHRKSLEIEEKLGRLEGMANDYANLGIVMQTRGDLDGARRAWTKARDLFKQLGANHMTEKMQGWIDGL